MNTNSIPYLGESVSAYLSDTIIKKQATQSHAEIAASRYVTKKKVERIERRMALHDSISELIVIFLAFAGGILVGVIGGI